MRLVMGIRVYASRITPWVSSQNARAIKIQVILISKIANRIDVKGQFLAFHLKLSENENHRSVCSFARALIWKKKSIALTPCECGSTLL